VTRDDYGRNHFDRRLCESEVATGTRYHRVSGNVASPGGDGEVEVASGCRLACCGWNHAYNDGWATSGRRVGAVIARVRKVRCRSRTKEFQAVPLERSEMGIRRDAAL